MTFGVWVAWEHFPHYGTFVRGITGNRWIPFLNGQLYGDLRFPVLLTWTTCWTNNRFAGDLRRHDARSCDVDHFNDNRGIIRSRKIVIFREISQAILNIFAWLARTYSKSLKAKEARKMLTHWGRVTHTCVSRLTITGSDNSLSPDRRQAIILTSAGILLIGPVGTNFIEISIWNSNIFIKKNAFENVVCEMASILSRPQFVNVEFCTQQYVCSWFTFADAVSWYTRPGLGLLSQLLSFRYFLNVFRIISLHWRHNDHDGVSNHQPRGCLLNRLFRQIKQNIRHRPLCGEFTGTGEIPAQRANYAENVSI